MSGERMAAQDSVQGVSDCVCVCGVGGCLERGWLHRIVCKE